MEGVTGRERSEKQTITPGRHTRREIPLAFGKPEGLNFMSTYHQQDLKSGTLKISVLTSKPEEQ